MVRSSAAARRLAGLAGLAGLALVPCVIASTTVAAADAATPPTAPPPGRSAVLIVHVDAGSAPTQSQTVRGDLVRARGQAGVRVRHDLAAIGSFSVQVPVALEGAVIARLRALPGVTGVELPVERHLTDAPTDDPDLDQQLPYLDAVAAPAAWHTQRGSAAVRIAVLDSGIDTAHEDLTGKVVGTYNAVHLGAPITDTVGHGTFVAGVAAAHTDNGVGVAGAGYDTSLLGVKVVSGDDPVAVDDEVDGIRWAADHHADIINLSLAGDRPSAAERAAVRYAQGKGVLVVAAAGNAGSATKQYPAAYPGVLAVGATDPATSRRAGFSSHGPWVSVGAPGVGIYSTVPPGRTSEFSAPAGYASGAGTSFAAPLVSAEAALLKAQSPSATAAQLRTAVIASAHGYQGLGLGAGQIDFARALQHIPPASQPTQLSATTHSESVSVSASSSAPQVRFAIRGGPASPPVTVANGRASAQLSSAGLADGSYTVSAQSCTAFGECADSAALTTVTVSNPAPQLVSPAADGTVTGRFTVRATAPAGGLRLLVDGKPAGLQHETPYVFRYSASALADGPHQLQVRSCSVDGSRCAGPLSAATPVTAAGLHPLIRSVRPPTFSPNGDGVSDTATLHFTLPDTETVTALVRARGRTLAQAPLGTLAKGRHTWTWNGTAGAGSRPVPDGRYTLALQTVHGTRGGWVSHPAVVDTVAPTLATPSGAAKLFYPHKDGYRDTFTPRTTIGGRGTVRLTMRNRHGHVVRTVRSTRSGGRVSLTWNGRSDAGHQVAAGTYHWQYSVTDAAGNTRRSAPATVRVSAKRLVQRTAHLSLPGARYSATEGDDHCAHATRRHAAFTRGVRLSNDCASDGYDIASASYTFTAGRAVRYGRLTIQVYGATHANPVELTASVQRTDGSLEVPRYEVVHAHTQGWITIASLPVAGHIDAARRIALSVVLDSRFAGLNEIDIRTARLLVTERVLR